MTFGQNRIVLFRQCNRRRTVHLNVATIVCLLLLGCQTIPDISNWNQSTKDVSSAVTAGFGTAADVNGDIAKRLDKVLESKPEFGDPAKRYSSVAKAISTRANDYEQLFGAVSDYSSSLAAISRASDNSQQTVDAVAGSLNQLVGAVGGTALAGSGFELSKTVGNEIIKVKAAHDFGEAVQKADPVIGQISQLLLNDLADLQRTVSITKEEAIRVAVEEPHKKDLEYRQALLRRSAFLKAAIAVAVAPLPATPNRPFPQTTSLLNVNDAAELYKVEQYLKDTDTWYKSLQDELNSALAVRAKSEQLVIQTSRAVSAWRDSHASLSTAVKQRRLPESGRLAAIAVRIRDLVAELKKEK